MPMDKRFEQFVNSLAPKYAELMGMTPVRVDSLPKSMPNSGVYLFSEGDLDLYAGRTRRLRRRLIEHSHLKILDAPFAFRLARETVGKVKASYTPLDSRKALLADPTFRQARLDACERIRHMDIRYVEMREPVAQTLLEIYAAVATGAPYNDFKTS
ncbi:hypothetical protein BH23ACT12_BH23ACT12_04860 [soil metagenome]